MDLPSIIIVAGAALILLGVTASWAVLHRSRTKRDAEAHARSIEEERHIPQSLHPVIDPNVCIGSLSCIKACPEGDILGILGGSAALIEASNCIGHGRCAIECPVGAIKLVFGTSERGVDLPEVDENFQSSRPGVFIVGELGGMGLIKNAIAQGLEAGAYLGETLPSRPSDGGLVDAVVVGAGPAGLAAAISLKQAGKSFRIVDQQELGGSVLQYPRQKIVMTERARIPGFGAFGKTRMSKEELLAGMRRLVSHYQLKIEERVRVSGIDGEQDRFVVRTSAGDIEARRVILAIGRRGTPRRLGVPGEDLEKVTYRLSDPDQYGGKKMLVVGGGDSAIEAAIMLADETDAEVSISYRGPAFARCRIANREAIAERIEKGRIRGLMSSEVKQIEARSVRLSASGSDVALPNDYVVVCAGGELPLGFLEESRISLTRHVGEQAITPPAARPWRQRGLGYRSSPELEAKEARHFNWLLFALGLSIIAALAANGWEYYPLSRAARLKSELHGALKPSGEAGLSIGLAATLVMLSNFLYALRKRWKRLKGAAPISHWLSFHVFVGLLSPAVIAFHAAFQWNNTIATSTFLSLLGVVLTGLAGRFAYGLIPSQHGKAIALEELTAQMERLRAEAYHESVRSSNPARLRQLIHSLTSIAPQRRHLIQLFWQHPRTVLVTRWMLHRLRPLFAAREDYAAFRHTAIAIGRMHTEIEFYQALRSFLGWWRPIHVLLAILLVLIMSVHIGISLYVGYGWSLFR